MPARSDSAQSAALPKALKGGRANGNTKSEKTFRSAKIPRMMLMASQWETLTCAAHSLALTGSDFDLRGDCQK